MSKYCSNCGQKLEDEALFCGNCGCKQEAPAFNPAFDKGAGYPPSGRGIPSQQGSSSGWGKKIALALVALLVVFSAYGLGSGGFSQPAAKPAPKTETRTVEPPSATTQTPAASKVPSAPKQEPAAAPAPKAPKQVLVTREAASRLIQNFYSELNRKDYNTAYSKLSQAWQSDYPFASWKEGYGTTVSQQVAVTRVETASEQLATVYYNLQAQDRKNGQLVNSRFQGHCDVIVENGRLVMANPEVQVVR